MLRAKCLFVAAPLLLVLAAPIVHAQPTGYEGYQVVRITIDNQTDMQMVRELQRLGDDFQVWSEVVRLGEIDVRVAPQAMDKLRASGLRYEVVIEDLQQHIDELYAGTGGRGFFDSLRTYNEHVQFMSDLAATYPDLAEMISLGQSVQGREMYALHITGDSEVKPGVIYYGAEHGNEQAPASVMAYIAEHLLANYDSDPEVAYLVDNVDWYILPIMNVDGYVSYSRYNAHYVDLNRNWDGPGSGQDPYGGPYPFSEPETTALRDFMLTHPRVRVHVDLHGYVPWIMWPWGHTPTHCPDHSTFQSLGSEMRSLVQAAGGGWYDIGTIYEVAYPTSGCSCNYAYGELNLWSFGIEVLDDDMPDICQELLNALLFLGEWIRGYDCNGNGVADADDIATGTSRDDNDNGVPDECESQPCPGDLNGDGYRNVSDFTIFAGAYGSQLGELDYNADADLNGNGFVNATDFTLFAAVFGVPCP
jgi:hypothetical protein